MRIIKSWAVIASIALIITSCGVASTASDSASKVTTKEKTISSGKSLFLPENFKVDITYIYPMRFQPRSVSGFSMTIKRDSVDLYLPYEGELYSAPIGNDGLNFKENATNVKRKQGKKGAEEMTFKLRHQSFVYDFRLTAFDNGNIDLSVQPSNGQSCSYSGTWEEVKKK